MRSELVTLQAVQTAGIAVRAQVVDQERISELMEQMDYPGAQGVDGSIVLCGTAWNTLTTDKHFFVFYEEYVCDEAGNEIPDEVDLFHIAVFEL